MEILVFIIIIALVIYFSSKSKPETAVNSELLELYLEGVHIAEALGLDCIKMESKFKARGVITLSHSGRYVPDLPDEKTSSPFYQSSFIEYLLYDFEEDKDGNKIDWESLPPNIKNWKSRARSHMIKSWERQISRLDSKGEDK